MELKCSSASVIDLETVTIQAFDAILAMEMLVAARAMLAIIGISVLDSKAGNAGNSKNLHSSATIYKQGFEVSAGCGMKRIYESSRAGPPRAPSANPHFPSFSRA